MAKFRVLGNLTHDRKNYKKGDIVEMSDAQAKAIPWAVEPLAASPALKKAPAGIETRSKGTDPKSEAQEK